METTTVASATDVTVHVDVEPICGAGALVRPAGEAEAVAALDYAHQQKRAFEVAELIAILHTADLWKIDSGAVFEGMERLIEPGHDGTPKVGDFLALEIGPLLEMTAPAALSQIGFALDLRHRHPQMFKKVIAGRVQVWRAKKVCERCAALSLEDCLQVDEKMADVLEYQTMSRAMRLLEEQIIAADVEAARRRAEAKRLQRFIKISPIDDGHVSIYGIVNPEDGLMFDFVLRKIANTLPAKPDPEIGRDVDMRRATALGILCRHFQDQPCQQPRLPGTTIAAHDHEPEQEPPPEWEPPQSDKLSGCAGSPDSRSDTPVAPEGAGGIPVPGGRPDQTPCDSSQAPVGMNRSAQQSAEANEPDRRVPTWRRRLESIFRDDHAQSGNEEGTGLPRSAGKAKLNHRDLALLDELSNLQPPAQEPPDWEPPGPQFLSTPAAATGDRVHGRGPDSRELSEAATGQEPEQRRHGSSLPACPRPPEGTAMPTHTLVVHVNATDLTPGVALVDSWGPLLAEQLPEFLKGSKVIVRPVIDPEQIQPSDAYQVPGRMRFAIEQRNAVDVYPYGILPAGRCDLDHTIAYESGKKGQTHPGNLGPLSRKAHRAKTHGGFRLEQPSPGLFVWTTKLGYRYAVTAAGTTRIQVP
ncbi:DUF222 domain-containing protein [Propionimicrobium sp. PCR01-08-3]|uniref:DUF222 domain-containing protein n=1 Tax=Propionimicrobium sp. PCR01-08-3 TaxID=3052086 RepID=UPI00255C9120|nr:DUF222 domain-containing protein [Propionimicrobium sp. PCR01-08-3]WIY81980.1 DUF222 domain-containing protein [Propionimicrobium sp. PCR01-08-3]